MANNLTYVGLTCGVGTGETRATPDLTGFLTGMHNTGPGAPSSQGAATATCMKVFDTGTNPPYPSMPLSWSGTAPTLVANNGGKPAMILFAFNNIPTAGNFETLLGTLPAGQKIGFVYQSEADGVVASFASDIHTISGNLNTALSFMQLHPVVGNAGGFYIRTNFPLINSALMSFYSTSTATTYIPAFGDVDAYGADMYHKGTQTNNHVLADNRYSNYLIAVKAKIGATNYNNALFAFPEYGIDLAGIGSEQARANLLQADFNDMTGANKPGQGIFLWAYWYKVGNSGQLYPFPASTETEAQASPTISVWQGIVSSTTGSSNVNVFGVTAQITTATPPPSTSGGAFFVRSMSAATTGTTPASTLSVLKDPNTQPGDLIQIWVASNSGTGITWSCPGFTATPAVS